MNRLLRLVAGLPGRLGAASPALGRGRGLLRAVFTDAVPDEIGSLGRTLIHAAAVGVAAGAVGLLFLAGVELVQRVCLEWMRTYRSSQGRAGSGPTATVTAQRGEWSCGIATSPARRTSLTRASRAVPPIRTWSDPRASAGSSLPSGAPSSSVESSMRAPVVAMGRRARRAERIEARSRSAPTTPARLVAKGSRRGEMPWCHRSPWESVEPMKPKRRPSSSASRTKWPGRSGSPRDGNADGEPRRS